MGEFNYTEEFYLSVGLGIIGFVILLFIFILIFKKPKPNKFDPVVSKKGFFEKLKEKSKNKKISQNNQTLPRKQIGPPKRYQRKLPGLS